MVRHACLALEGAHAAVEALVLEVLEHPAHNVGLGHAHALPRRCRHLPAERKDVVGRASHRFVSGAQHNPHAADMFFFLSTGEAGGWGEPVLRGLFASPSRASGPRSGRPAGDDLHG